MEQNLTDISKLVYQNHLGLRKLAASALTDIPVLPAYRTTTRRLTNAPSWLWYTAEWFPL